MRSLFNQNQIRTLGILQERLNAHKFTFKTTPYGQSLYTPDQKLVMTVSPDAFENDVQYVIGYADALDQVKEA